MSLFQTQYPNNSRVVSGTPAIFKDDVVLLCNTSLGAVTINLLEIPDNYWNTTWKLYVVDNSSNASVNPIIINAGLGQTINGASSITLSLDDESAVIRISSNNQFIANLSSSSSSIVVKDEGVEITTAVSSFNFVGDLVDATAIGNDVTVNVSQYDSGWLSIPNYDNYLQGNYGMADTSLNPKFRVINRQVFISGTIVLPLADNLGNLVSPFSDYPYTQSVDLYEGIDGGYSILSGYKIQTKNPILPTTLSPNNSTAISPNIFNVRRIIASPNLIPKTPSGQKYCMNSYFFNCFVFTDGTLIMNTFPYLESDNSSYLNEFSDLRRAVSAFSATDLVNDYSTYKNSFDSLGVDYAIVKPSDIAFDISFDPNEPSQYGGFQFVVNSSWLIDEQTSINDIKEAVDKLTLL